MKPTFTQLMQEAQKMQEKMKETQKELSNTSVIGEAGAGLIKVKMNGRHDVLSVTITPEAQKESLETLQDLITAAINDANRKIEKISAEKLSAITSHFKLPSDQD